MAEYISKDSAISILDAKAEMAACTPAQPYFLKAAKMIELLPAADVAPVVHGMWVEKQSVFGETATCSNCGEKYYTVGILPHYCPNCGARMDLEEKNDPADF